MKLNLIKISSIENKYVEWDNTYGIFIVDKEGNLYFLTNHTSNCYYSYDDATPEGTDWDDDEIYRDSTYKYSAYFGPYDKGEFTTFRKPPVILE